MFPILLSLGSLTVSTYSALVAAGWLLSVSWLLWRRGEIGLSRREIWSSAFWVFCGAELGGKLLYFASSPQDMRLSLAAFRYGFVFYGGFGGSLLAGWWWCRRRGISFVRLADWYAAALALGHAVGRLGCLAAGCCYGRRTALPWGLRLAGDCSRHPTQLYESTLNLALFGLLVHIALPRIQDGRWRRGSALLTYVLGYAAARFCVEFFRGDDRGAFHAGLSPAQWIALASAAAACALIKAGPCAKAR